MTTPNEIAVAVVEMFEEIVENEPVEAFLAFAGLFATTGVFLKISEEDAMNLINNVYKDTLAQKKMGVH